MHIFIQTLSRNLFQFTSVQIKFAPIIALTLLAGSLHVSRSAPPIVNLGKGRFPQPRGLQAITDTDSNYDRVIFPGLRQHDQSAPQNVPRQSMNEDGDHTNAPGPAMARKIKKNKISKGKKDKHSEAAVEFPNTLQFFQDANPKAFFLLMGDVRVGLDFADMVLELDFGEIQAEMREVCKSPAWFLKNVLDIDASDHTKRNRTLGSLVPTVDSLTEMCKIVKSDMNIFEHLSISSNLDIIGALAESLDRVRRQLIAGGFALVAGISALGGYLVGDTVSADQTQDDLIKRQDHIISVITDENHQLQTNKAQIAKIKQFLDSEGRELITKDRRTTSGVDTSNLLLSHLFQYTRMLGAFFNMLNNKKLDPILVDVELLKEKLSAIVHQASLVGRRVDMANIYDLYEYDTSLAVFPNLMCRIVVHVPTFHEDAEYNLYKFIRSPMVFDAIKNQTALGIFNPPSPYLALSKDESY